MVKKGFKKSFSRSNINRINSKNKKKRAKKHFIANSRMVKFYHSKMPFPPTFFTRFQMYFNVFFAVGTNNINQTTFGANTLYRPFSVTQPTGSTALGSPPWSLDAPYVVTSNPQGYSNLVNDNIAATTGVYNRYKVYSSKVSVECIPVVLSDNMVGTILPIINQNNPSSFTAAQADRFAVTCNYTASQNGRVKMTKFIKMAEFFGLTNKQYTEDVSGEYTANGNASPNQLCNWCLFLSTSDGVVTTSGMTVRVKVDYWVQLYAEQANKEVTS